MSIFNLFIERNLKKPHENNFSSIEILRWNSPMVFNYLIFVISVHGVFGVKVFMLILMINLKVLGMIKIIQSRLQIIIQTLVIIKNHLYIVVLNLLQDMLAVMKIMLLSSVGQVMLMLLILKTFLMKLKKSEVINQILLKQRS